MDRTEMIAAVERLFSADGTEAELDGLLDRLDRATPGGGISDLIYHFNQKRTPEQIVDMALARSAAEVIRL